MTLLRMKRVCGERITRRAIRTAARGVCATRENFGRSGPPRGTSPFPRRLGEKICMVTCHDYPSAAHARAADVDVALCGDSLGMVALGYETTVPVTLDEMLHHCRAARRGLGSDGPLLVCDLPFGSYEGSDPSLALKSAQRAMKDGGADAVKVEGGAKLAPTVAALVDAGVAVVGHVGLTPQRVATLGGFRAQGRTAAKARRIVDDALALEAAGACAVVVECVPAVVGGAVAAALAVPAIGIGAGGGTDGQVLVYHDLLGVFAHPHHAAQVPKFCRVFADVGERTHAGLASFRDAVRGGQFPSPEFAPYAMPEAEAAAFRASLARDAASRATTQEDAKRRQIDEDEYETVKLY